MNHMSPKDARAIVAQPHGILDDDNFPEFDPNDPANAHIVDQVMDELERDASDIADAQAAAKDAIQDRARAIA